MDDKEKDIIENNLLEKDLESEKDEDLENYNHGNISGTNLSQELKDSFLSYAMSVIVDRALPDVRDGLKPVHRRILYAMNDLSIYANTAYKKSARIVGEVIGKYHPHGDTSVYDAMVRMAQPFSTNEPLVDGHGNFGSVDGDGAAAMRYTEARMSKIAMEMVRDLEKETVDFQDNYDATEKEPKVLPSRYPNLLVNGSTGIAVGLATKIPPHNLIETIDGCIKLIDDKDTNLKELMQIIKAPDFPTGGQILNLQGLYKAYETGRGNVIIRAKAEIERYKQKSAIIIKEIPYEVNKTSIIEKIAVLVKDKVLDGIVDLRDESNRDGMRVVIELRRDVNPEIMLNNLFKYTNLQSTYSIYMIALVNGKPEQLSLIEILKHYIEFQIEVIQRRTIYDLNKAEQRQHILNGLIKVLNDVDRAIQLIKESKDPEEAKIKLMDEYVLDDVQAKAILDMKLQRLTSFEIDKIVKEHEELSIKINEYKLIISSREKKEEILKDELTQLKKYGKERVSTLLFDENLNIENEDLIKERDVIVTVTKNGYIKRIDADQYKTQRRGGVGVTNIKMHDDDFVEKMINTSTHQDVLIFTNLGRVYKLRAHQIPEGSKISKGIPVVNLINFMENETIQAITPLKEYKENQYLVMLTKKGYIKKSETLLFENINSNGKIAIALEEDDELLDIKPVKEDNIIIIASKLGLGVKFSSNTLRPMGRTARGNLSIKLRENDTIIGFAVLESEEDEILLISEKGIGKRTKSSEIRLLSSRRGKGVILIKITEKTGNLAAIKVVDDQKDLICSTDQGIVIRTHVKDISTLSRNSQGVIIIKIKDEQKVATITIDDIQEENLEEDELTEKEGIENV